MREPFRKKMNKKSLKDTQCLKKWNIEKTNAFFWTFARHQSPSYQTYSDVKHTSRKPAIKSTILEGQTLDLSLPGYVYKQKTDFMKKSDFGILRKNLFEPMNPYNF